MHSSNGIPNCIPFLDLITPHVELEKELTGVFRRALLTAGFIGGPVVENFEKAFAAFCGASHSVAVSSGTDALRFAIMACGVRPGLASGADLYAEIAIPEFLCYILGSEGMWSPRWSPDGRFIAGLSGSGLDKLTLYDLRTRKQTQLSDLPSDGPSWSWDGEFLFFESGFESGFESDQWVWRVRMRDRKVERITNLTNIRVAGWVGVRPLRTIH